MYSYGHPQMAKQKQDEQLEHTYIQQLCENTGCSPENLPEAINDRKKWRERVKDIHVGGMTWWWWWLFIYLQTVKWLQLLLCNTNNQFRITVKEFQVLPLNTNNFIQHFSFICTQLNSSRYCYVSLTIQLNISHFFTHS